MVFGNLPTGIEIFESSDTSNIKIPLLGSRRIVTETTYRNYPISVSIDGDISFTENEDLILQTGLFNVGEALMSLKTSTTGAGYYERTLYKFSPQDYSMGEITRAIDDEIDKAKEYIDTNFENDYVDTGGVMTVGGGGYAISEWSPDLTFTLVDTAEAKSLTDFYSYALYKVDFENGEPEWRIYSEGPKNLLDDEGNDRFDNLTYTFSQDSPMITIQRTDGEPFEDIAPYMATYTTEDEGKEALKNSIPVMGCRDQAASNYDYTATLDDGSCSYTEEGSNMMPLLIMGGIAAVVLLM